MLRGSRTKQPSPVPVRLTNRWKARTKKKIGVSFARAHIESQGNHLPIVATKLPKGGEASSTFWTRHKTRRHTNEQKEHPPSEEGTICSNCDKCRRIQTGQLKLKKKRKELCLLTLTPFLPTHPSLQKSQPVHVERKVPLLWQFQNKRAALALKTAKEVSSANVSSLNTHPSFLGIKCPLPCGSLMPPVLAPNPPRKETPLHLTNLPDDFKSEVIDVVLVIFKRRRAFTSCPLIANAAPNSVFFGQHTSTHLSA